MTATDTTRALVMREPGQFREEGFATPAIGEHDALLTVRATGLCGSDLASYTGVKSHPGPVILGHEVVGTIDRIGATAARLWGVAEGDRVALEEGIPCMVCSLCQSGRSRLCERSGLRYGYTSIDTAPSLWGGFADRMYLHPATQLHRVPETVSDQHATLFIPLSNGLAWMRDSADLRPGESVVVLGPGQHGVATALAARRMGAGRVIVVGTSHDASRLALVEAHGATGLVVDDPAALVPTVREALGGTAEVVVDLVPNAPEPLTHAVDLTATGGRLLIGGMKRGTPVPFDTDQICRKELTVRGLWARPSWAITAAFQWLQDDPAIGDLCDATYALSDLDTAFQDALGAGATRPLHSAIVTDGHP